MLLFWKCLLLVFGSGHDVENTKLALQRETFKSREEQKESLITTSPLEYHLFRQEIISKYPTYNPPPPLLPLEPENNSVLPPLASHPSRQISHDDLSTAGTTANVGTSIINQPVHIATPAPSPPPSPAGPGGKGAKKQNYQTNQNFPFLYPPLDEQGSFNGESVKLHEQLVNKRWQDGNVPASIHEAGQLFASRMRMSRSLRQLWDVRERYIKEERGWGGAAADLEDERDDDDTREDKIGDDDDYDDGDSDSELDSPECIERRALPRLPLRDHNNLDRRRETDDNDAQERLDTVDTYYVRWQIHHLI